MCWSSLSGTKGLCLGIAGAKTAYVRKGIICFLSSYRCWFEKCEFCPLSLSEKNWLRVEIQHIVSCVHLLSDFSAVLCRFECVRPISRKTRRKPTRGGSGTVSSMGRWLLFITWFPLQDAFSSFVNSQPVI